MDLGPGTASGWKAVSASPARRLAAVIVLALALVVFGSVAPASMEEREQVEIVAVTAAVCLVATRRAQVLRPGGRGPAHPEREGWNRAVLALASLSDTFDSSGRGPPGCIA